MHAEASDWLLHVVSLTVVQKDAAPRSPWSGGTGSHRCSMAPVFDSLHAVVTSREGAEQFLWKMPGNNRRPKNPLL